jgi:esterase FrsA
LAETLASVFGRWSAEEWIEHAPKLSLLDQKVFDKQCAPLLCVNGIQDSVFPIADMHLLLERGNPKAARFYAGGHMGGGDSQTVIVQWLKEKLSA